MPISLRLIHLRISSMSIVRFENVFKEYSLGEQKVQALRDISLDINDGEFLAIAGPSGSGKSTLLNLIGCIDTPSLGKIFINGQDVSDKTLDELSDLRARTIGFIFQTFNLFHVLSAEENVEYPLLQFKELSKAERRNRVVKFLDIVGQTKRGPKLNGVRYKLNTVLFLTPTDRSPRFLGLQSSTSQFLNLFLETVMTNCHTLVGI